MGDWGICRYVLLKCWRRFPHRRLLCSGRNWRLKRMLPEGWWGTLGGLAAKGQENSAQSVLMKAMSDTLSWAPWRPLWHSSSMSSTRSSIRPAGGSGSSKAPGGWQPAYCSVVLYGIFVAKWLGCQVAQDEALMPVLCWRRQAQCPFSPVDWLHLIYSHRKFSSQHLDSWYFSGINFP